MSPHRWSADLEAGQDALERGDWLRAVELFARAAESAEDEAAGAEAHEGLGIAEIWRENGKEAIAALEGGFRGYRRRGDTASAVRTSALLAESTFTFEGKPAVSRGWERRSRTLVEQAGPEPTAAGALLLAETAYLALLRDHDVARAGTHARESAAMAAELGLADLEVHGRALDALASVFAGDLEVGMAILDECGVAATSGEVADPSIAGTVCCYLIFGCEWTKDRERARDWCERLLRLTEHWLMGGLHGLCRTHYGSVLLDLGEDVEAESELMAGLAELVERRPGLAAEAWVRLAELRRRQRRYDDAAACLAQAGRHPLTLSRRAVLALDQGDARRARRLARQALATEPQLPPTERAVAAETVIAASVGLADIEAARRGLAALEELHRTFPAPHVQSTVLRARAMMALARGDLDGAREAWEAAAEDASAIGADLDVAPSRHLRELLEDPTNPATKPRLSPRETEVIRMIGRGRTNAEIAEALSLSLRTVERHIANAYRKLDVHGPAARAQATAYAIRAGL